MTGPMLRPYQTVALDRLDAAFAARLRPYQRLGTAWLWHLHRHGLGGILADVPTLGLVVGIVLGVVGGAATLWSRFQARMETLDGAKSWRGAVRQDRTQAVSPAVSAAASPTARAVAKPRLVT